VAQFRRKVNAPWNPISPGWTVLGGVALLVGLVALTALLVPLRRLQRLAPHELLREE